MAAGKKDDKPKESDPEADAAESQEKKKKKKLILMIGLGVLLLILLLGGTVFVTVKLLVPKHAATADQESSETAETSEAAASEPSLPPIYFTLKPNFTVNYDVAGKQHYLQCEMTFLYREEKMEKFLELHMPALRNGLVMLLSNQVFEELQTVEGKEKLRAAALKTVQEIISKEHASLAAKDKEKDKEKEKEKGKKKAEDNVEQILFTHFVMQ